MLNTGSLPPTQLPNGQLGPFLSQPQTWTWHRICQRRNELRLATCFLLLLCLLSRMDTLSSTAGSHSSNPKALWCTVWRHASVCSAPWERRLELFSAFLLCLHLIYYHSSHSGRAQISSAWPDPRALRRRTHTHKHTRTHRHKHTYTHSQTHTALLRLGVWG